uniref:Uncharacterized protein LOC110200323 n=1 Tax=Phascolarctos cinereus TaxID=38626 RepID=A0A6P5JAU2_PHACI|nr:uncharacterized protein LOC110200323 [Phascolarctos cinereus]
MKQELELGQGRLAALLKANQEDRETRRNLQESYDQCQAEIESLRKQSGTQQAEPRPGKELGPANEGKRSYGPAAEPRLEGLRPWGPKQLAAESPTQEEVVSGRSGCLPRGQQGQRFKCLPRWKRICRTCGAWGRAERRRGAWDCAWCRAQPLPCLGHFSLRGGHTYPGRARAVAAAFPREAPGMQEPGRVWGPAAGPWRGPPRRGAYPGLPWRGEGQPFARSQGLGVPPVQSHQLPAQGRVLQVPFPEGGGPYTGERASFPGVGVRKML